MTTEELIKSVEGLRHEVALLQSEYSSGMEKFHGVIVTLLAGEHFHALPPVIEAMPIADFKAKLAKMHERVAKIIIDASASLKKLQAPAKDKEAEPPVKEG